MKTEKLQLKNSYLTLPEVFYTKVAPTPVTAPRLVVFNKDLADELGLELSSLSTEEQTKLFAGNTLPPDAKPLAQAYAGHQFGHFTMLGDGRAHLLGEQITPDGNRYDIQLKGSGRTPYSRGGDGRAVLGPMLREYLIAEAMAALGIPTTRSLAVVTSGEPVHRETLLQGAILTRIASSHLRVGTFQYARGQQDAAALQALLDYTIDRHDPELKNAGNPALALLEAVMHRQADLITHWMRVGFIHGVMNTDNMALSGETIDYGPCAFMDAYDPGTVFSSIDTVGRYAYAQQPGIAAWNLARLAEALLPLIADEPSEAVELAEKLVNTFADVYRERWLNMMRSKLGLFGTDENDYILITDLLSWMKKNHADYTNTFRGLTHDESPAGPPYGCKAFTAWHDRWQARLEQNDQPLESAKELMRRTNPAVIPRNHKVEEALAAATDGDLKPFHNLHSALQSPYEEREGLAPYQSPPESSERVYQTFCGT
ncbi:MAG: YdiU family protein [Planctomycetota bacterium]